MRGRLALPAVVALACVACNGSSLDIHKQGTILHPVDLAMRNFVVVHVDPAGCEVGAEVKGFNVFHAGDLLHDSWDELTLTCGGESYFVTTEGVGNNEIRVNGKLYKFDVETYDQSNGPLLSITFGGATVAGTGTRYQGNYLGNPSQRATLLFDAF